MMEKVNSTMGLVRTKSDQLVESMAAAMAAMKSPPSGDGALLGTTVEGSSGTLSRKPSRRLTSPGRSNSNRSYIRKTRSAQLKLDIDDLSNGAALSRASSASFGLSFSFTGFNVPPEDIADSKPFSDEDIPEDLEAGTRKKRTEAEKTPPISLKASGLENLATTQINGIPLH